MTSQSACGLADVGRSRMSSYTEPPDHSGSDGAVGHDASDQRVGTSALRMRANASLTACS